MEEKIVIQSLKTDKRVSDILSQLKDEKYYDLDLNFENEREYSTLFSIQSDLEYSLEIVTKLMEIRIADQNKVQSDDTYSDRDLLIKRSLLTSAIITYCRCFGETKARTKNLIPEELFDNLPHSFAEYNLADFHRRLKTLRNQYFAHAGNSELEIYTTKVKFRILSSSEVEITLQPTLIAFYSLNSKELETFFILLKLLTKQTKEKLDKLKRDFFESLTEKMIKDAIDLKVNYMHAR